MAARQVAATAQAWWALPAAAVAILVVAAAAQHPTSRTLAWILLAGTWALAGAVLSRSRDRHAGTVALGFAALACTAALTGPAPGGGVAGATYALAVALLAAVALHAVVVFPAAKLSTRGQRVTVAAGYLLAGATAVFIWSFLPSVPAWPLLAETALAAWLGVAALSARAPRVRGREHIRVRLALLALALAAEIGLVGVTARILVGRPPHVLTLAGAAAVAVPLAFLLEQPRHAAVDAHALLVGAIRLLGLTALVVGLYLLVVLGLGRPPSADERTTLALSLLAAGLATALYVPVRERLTTFANRLSRGARDSPDSLLRTFSAGLSRAIPLEELLLQLAESLRAGLALDRAEIWTGSAGTLERVVSDPDGGRATLRLTAAEEAVVARADVSGPLRVGTWLPHLVEPDGGSVLRVAPITNAGELLGLIVARRAPDGEEFDERAERVLSELARQLGLALRNVRLDSALQASLDELQRQADELRASRARIVAVADAERRRIERDFHDGAQQYLVGVAVNLRVARGLADSDPERAKAILDELRESVPAAVQEFRDLAHGIYPPLLQDRGLGEALANAARRAAIPARVEAAGSVSRYEPSVEAAVYFCCLEALQNAAKHAGDGASATVRVREDSGTLLFEVVDDGVGLDGTSARTGTGLTNMQDRVGAIGGRLRVESAPGQGTTIAGAIPLAGY